MRGLLSAAVAALLLGGGAAAAACLQPTESRAFAIHTLKTELMVVALTCREEDAYNAFVERFQDDLSSAGRELQGHFRRTYGDAYQRRLDAYITNLANVHSREGVRQGLPFCGNTAPIFERVMLLENGAALAHFSTDTNLTQAYPMRECRNRTRMPGQAKRPG